MKTTTQDSYSRLQAHLEAWKDRQETDQINPSLPEQFRLVAQETLLPELRKLARVLEEGGIECDVFNGDEDNLDVGIRLATFSAVLRLSPADRPTYIRAVIAGGRWPNDDLEWFIPYHQIRNGGLGRELQAVMLHLLKRRQ